MVQELSFLKASGEDIINAKQYQLYLIGIQNQTAFENKLIQEDPELKDKLDLLNYFRNN